MDTNQRTANNYQVNTFTKGMNSDTSYDMIGADQYLFGQNIRITNNTLLFGDIDSNNTEMVVAPVSKGLEIDSITISGDEWANNLSILATESVGNVGVLILKNGNGNWRVYKVVLTNNETNNHCRVALTLIKESDITTDRDRFSTTMIKETDNVLKVYISDAAGPPICIFLEHPTWRLYEKYKNVAVDYLRTNAYFPATKATLQKTFGNLKTQQVQYTYRFYSQYAYVSKLAPLTNKIHIINDDRNQEQGNAENTLTNIGMNLIIPKPTVGLFDRVQVFRISYIKHGQQPQIYLVCDKKIDETNESVLITDTGTGELQEYSMEEFSALQTQSINPEVIQSGQGYLFAASVKDETVLSDADTDNVVVSHEITYAQINIDKSGGESGEIPEQDNTKIDENLVQPGSVNVYNYFQDCKINPKSEDGTNAELNYNNMFVSSLLRSLRVDETYKYGIVFYDKYGKRSNVVKAFDVSTSNLSSTPLSNPNRSWPIGLKVKLKNVDTDTFVGFEVVRQEKNFNNTKNLLQVALSRPVRQGKYGTSNNNYRTTYYPNILLTSQFFYYNCIKATVDTDDTNLNLWNQYFDHNGTNVENFTLYQLFAPEINYYRNDTLSKLTGSSLTLQATRYQYENASFVDSKGVSDMSYQRRKAISKTASTHVSDLDTTSAFKVHKIENGVDIITSLYLRRDSAKKITRTSIFKLDLNGSTNATSQTIKRISDVKNPNWEDGFSNIQNDSSNASKVSAAIKQYKSYSTTIGNHEYNNWASGGMYDLAATQSETLSQPGNDGNQFVFKLSTDYPSGSDDYQSLGWIGPGPICFLAELQQWWEDEDDTYDENNDFEKHFVDGHIGTLVCNIQHTISEVESSKHLPYYGFGNYFKFEDLKKTDDNEYVVNVFDGDVYNDYVEFTNLFKTYEFQDQKYSLQSGQIVYYIPLESEVNTRFDYGCNYLNTNSKNLMLEPGKIVGITVQDRPLHQYNRIYSDNNWSINYFFQDTDLQTVKSYPHRIYYSQLKTSGEAIDNWQIFKPADFIDADSRYGAITNLLSVDNELYFWQESAFGKLSVNERSLVTDDNGETVQLGQGGVLQRVDYLSTKYGMRKQDFCAISTENDLFWIDVLNKAILMHRGGQVVNYGEQLNVQNLINSGMTPNDYTSKRPTISYDLQTNELLCQAFVPNNESILQQLVFNTKLNVAVSVYSRSYNDIISFNNVLIGLTLEDGYARFTKYNMDTDHYCQYLKPTILEFVVNSSASQTKVFDSQKVVTMNRNGKEEEEYEGDHLKSKTYWNKNGRYVTQYIDNKEYAFRTDIKTTNNKPNAVTDREGNIVYDIPRVGNNDWGDRMRGKWMVERITDNEPKQDYCISHIITKFRQSYS